MRNMTSAIQNSIPISVFNRGQAGQVFDDVQRTGAKIVLKNNMPECVLLAPDDYVELMDELSDARMAILAFKRLEHFDPNSAVSADAAYADLGISSDDLYGYEEVALE